MASKYHKEKSKKILERVGDQKDGVERLTFKDIDGIRKLADLELPGLLKLPTGSCEAIFLRGARNNGFGYVPINEYIRDRQSILDKNGNNGIFLNSHDDNMEAVVFKTTESVPEIPANNIFWYIFVNTEDSFDLLKVAGCNGLLRRLTLSTSDCSGMDDIPRISCTEVNEALSLKVLAMHNIFREFYPKHLKFKFSIQNENVNGEEGRVGLARILEANRGIMDEDLPVIFTGRGVASSLDDPDLLKFVKTQAKIIAEKTSTIKDSSVKQETRNLVSLIGQKAAEMHLVNSLISNDLDGLTDLWRRIFTDDDGEVYLEEVDIREASHLVEQSRIICGLLVEAEDFQNNFGKYKPNIPKTYFKNESALSLVDKAEIFSVHYIKKAKALAKSVNQSLKKNKSFQAFGVPLPKIIDRLKRRKLVSLIEEGVVDNGGRQKKRYRLTYDFNVQDHADFLNKYQGIYPGNSF